VEAGLQLRPAPRRAGPPAAPRCTRSFAPRRTVSLIGWSLGGIYAREIAKEQPDHARCVITLGTPFTGHPRATNAWRFYEMVSGQAVHDLNWSSRSACRRRPHDVDLQQDRRRRGLAVQPQPDRHPHTENIEVHASHIGMGMNPLALYAIADRLAQDPEPGALRRQGRAALVLQGHAPAPCRPSWDPDEVVANGIGIEVDDQGLPDGEPLLLIMGLGMQLTGWPDELVQVLVSRGFRVLRFDNRDIGLSQYFDHLGVPNLAWAGMRHALGLPVRAPYSLADMAGDAVGVLDALGIAQRHVCGASMGGMIAQHLAARTRSA
jgi:pimeloyl-ACP methyl ester carboxylesterase